MITGAMVLSRVELCCIPCQLKEYQQCNQLNKIPCFLVHIKLVNKHNTKDVMVNEKIDRPTRIQRDLREMFEIANASGAKIIINGEQTTERSQHTRWRSAQEFGMRTKLYSLLKCLRFPCENICMDYLISFIYIYVR